MGYSNHYSGTITITPPLTAAEIRTGPASVLKDCRLRVHETVKPTDEGEIVVRTADALEPTCDGMTGRDLVEELQLMVDHIGLLTPERAFAGFIEVTWDAGYEEPPSRYVVRDGRVVEDKPLMVWPEDVPVESGDTARLSRVWDVLAQLRADHALAPEGPVDQGWRAGLNEAIRALEKALGEAGA